MSFENSPFAASLYQAGTPKRQIIHPADLSISHSPESSFMTSFNTPVPRNVRRGPQQHITSASSSSLIAASAAGASSGSNSTPSNRYVVPLYSTPVLGPSARNLTTPSASGQRQLVYRTPLGTDSLLKTPSTSTPTNTGPSFTPLTFSNPSSEPKGGLPSDASSKELPGNQQQQSQQQTQQMPTGAWESSVTKKIRSRVVNTELATRNLLVNFFLFIFVRVLIHLLSTSPPKQQSYSQLHHYHTSNNQNHFTRVSAASAAPSSGGLADRLVQYVPYDYQWIFLLVASGSQYLVYASQVLFAFNILVSSYSIFSPFSSQIDDVKITETQRKLLDIPESPVTNIVSQELESPPKYKKSSAVHRSYSSRPSSSSSSVSSNSISPFASPSKSALGSGNPNSSFSVSPIRAPALSGPTPMMGSPLKAHLYNKSPKQGEQVTSNSLVRIETPVGHSSFNNTTSPLHSSASSGFLAAPPSPLSGLSKKLNSPVSRPPSFDQATTPGANPAPSQLLQKSASTLGGFSPSGSSNSGVTPSKDLRRKSMVAAASSAGSTSVGGTAGVVNNTTSFSAPTSISGSPNTSTSSSFTPQSPTFNVSGRFKYLANTPNRHRVVRDI